MIEVVPPSPCPGAHADRDPQVSPQVVLLDLKLPEVGGMEMLEQICLPKQDRSGVALLFVEDAPDEAGLRLPELRRGGETAT